MCLASYPPRLGRQGLFIPKCWPSPLLMFSVTSKENKCKYWSDWVERRSGKSEVLSMRVALLCSYFMLCCLFPALRSHVPPQGPSLALLPYGDALPACAWPMWTIASTMQLGAGIPCAGSWSSLKGSHMYFYNSKHGVYHYWIHTQTANKHPHSSPWRKDVITRFIVFTVVSECYLLMGSSSGWHSEGTSLKGDYIKHTGIIVISKQDGLNSFIL